MILEIGGKKKTIESQRQGAIYTTRGYLEDSAWGEV